MRIDSELAGFSTDQDSVLTIGVFDGVHRGHRHLISRLRSEATDMGCLAGVVTFRNHPASVLRRDFKPQYLTSLDERLRLLKELGVDQVIPVTFDLELSKLRAREFLALLRRHLRLRGLLIGPDFSMGHDREGDAKALAALGQEMGFSVSVVDLLRDGEDAVRSTLIRQALAQGDVARVEKMLGRSFALAGVVVRGVGRGRTLGFPTANLEPPQGVAVPGDGIYATWAHVKARRYMAATSIGTRPTFDERRRTIESFILDFEGDLYEHEIRLEFVRRLRDEVKYDTVQALQEQVDRDVDQTRAILGVSHPNPG